MGIPHDVLKGIDRLKPLPATAQAMIASLSGENASLARVATLIEYDQAVASTVLRMAKSGFYAGYVPVDNVRDAVVRLGTQRLLELVLGDYLRTMLVAAPMFDLTEDELWAHGAAASLAVRSLTQQVPRANIPPIAATAALVHDVGKLVMVRYLKADASALLALCRDKGLAFVDAERETFGCDHAEVGAAIARKWSFPEEVTLAIECHHRSPLPDVSRVLDAVALANLVAKVIGVGLGAEGFNFSLDSVCGKRLGVDFTIFGRACLQTMDWLRELRQVYGRPAEAPPPATPPSKSAAVIDSSATIPQSIRTRTPAP